MAPEVALQQPDNAMWAEKLKSERGGGGTERGGGRGRMHGGITTATDFAVISQHAFIDEVVHDW